MNDKTIIETAINSKEFNKEQLYLINLCRMQLQVIFIYNLLEYRTNKVKENYSNSKIDRLYSSQFQWPAIERDNRANKI